MFISWKTWVSAIKWYNARKDKKDKISVEVIKGKRTKQDIKNEFIEKAGRAKVAYYIVKAKKFTVGFAAVLAVVPVATYKISKSEWINHALLHMMWSYYFDSDHKTKRMEMETILARYPSQILIDLYNIHNNDEAFMFIWKKMPEARDYILDTKNKLNRDIIIAKHRKILNSEKLGK